jgi:hypothetical protein
MMPRSSAVLPIGSQSNTETGILVHEQRPDEGEPEAIRWQGQGKVGKATLTALVTVSAGRFLALRSSRHRDPHLLGDKHI